MDQYFHVKVVLGMVLGLAIATLLHGFARFVQHPSRREIYWVHIGWTVFMFFFLTHFWWWEFNLSKVGDWDQDPLMASPAVSARVQNVHSARRFSPSMAVALGKKSNAVDGRFGRAPRGFKSFPISVLPPLDGRSARLRKAA